MPRNTPAEVHKLVESIFEEYDKDANGYITDDEYAEVATSFPFMEKFSVVCARGSIYCLLFCGLLWIHPVVDIEHPVFVSTET